MDVAAVDSILTKYPETKGNLISILHEVQNRFRYLPEEELRYISKKTGVPITQIYSIANFYNRFTLEPRGKNRVCVCLGTACHVKGAERIMNEMERVLGINTGESTDDLSFSLEEVRCIGACSLAPAVVINEDTHSKVTPKQIGQLLKKYQQTSSPKA
ncbi:MAG: NAD(P)H-dependent oxidoreductase subunit E [Desulfobacteraceae bacterium]|nr:NAD(P)H-dependent oxidoreductase subunit E [Desulfobacteraceae bacterium]